MADRIEPRGRSHVERIVYLGSPRTADPRGVPTKSRSHRAKVRRAAQRRRRPSRRPPRRPKPSVPRRVPIAPSEYVRFEIDLVHEAFDRRGLPFLRRLESIFREREVVEVEGLFRLVAEVLHALGPLGFGRVDHWEVHPGGWLPLPEPAHERLAEPVGHLLNALRSPAWRPVAGARGFSVRLSGSSALRADLTVRRVHRERGHAITLELRGAGAEKESRSIERALRGTLTIARLRRRRAPLLSTHRR